MPTRPSSPNVGVRAWAWVSVGIAVFLVLVGAVWVYQRWHASEVTIRTGDSKQNGTVDLDTGHAAEVPAWIGDYPGSEPKSAFLTRMGSDVGGSFAFKTKDPVKRVADFYESRFRKVDPKTSTTLSHEGGGVSGALISAESEKQSAIVLLGVEDGITTVSVTYKMRN